MSVLIESHAAQMLKWKPCRTGVEILFTNDVLLVQVIYHKHLWGISAPSWPKSA